jgi:phosphatidylethanolamine/phosphatidyl-N-methylethanolamine N-methyltransferase
MTINSVPWNRFRYRVYAPFYNVLVTPLNRSRQRAIELLQVQPGTRVLLVGCGTGLDLDFLPSSAHVTAIDITPAMVQRTRRRGHSLRRSNDTSVMNAQGLAFADASFDYVVLHLVVAVVPDPIVCMQEAVRVLKVGGTLSIFDKFLPGNATPSLARRMLSRAANVLFSDLNRQLGPLLAPAPLEVQRQEDAGLGGAYTISQAVKLQGVH